MCTQTLAVPPIPALRSSGGWCRAMACATSSGFWRRGRTVMGVNTGPSPDGVASAAHPRPCQLFQ
jgi:hypothetical protein